MDGPLDARTRWLKVRTDGFTRRGARWSAAWLVFLTLSGLAIWALPFNAYSEHSVLVHTAVGIVLFIPFVIEMVRHVAAYWTFPFTATKFTGYAAALMALVACVSGFVLTGQAAFGRRIDYSWRMLHVVSTFALAAFLAPHLVTVWLHARRGVDDAGGRVRLAAVGFLRLCAAATAALMAGAALLALLVPRIEFRNEFPADYEQDPYGSGPFAPSLAKTASGGAFDDRTLSGSEGCGTSGCHEEILAEWQPSAHRYAAMDVGFQAIQGAMAAQNGPVSTRYCAGCHDPISLFSGTKNIGIPPEELSGLVGTHEGISCLSCHAIEQTDVKGNANYVMHQPGRYAWETRDGALARWLSDFTLRAYPDHHVATLSRRMFKTPEFCAACHKQFIDQEVNKVGWVQLQNQYDNWRNSRWNHAGHADQTLECRECHMPLVDSRDPAAGDAADWNRTADDGKHRSHRFLGANQFMPLLHKLPGADEHCALTEKWLKGEYEIPEIADRWRPGEAVPLRIEVPEEVAAGATVPLRVHILNNKVGHDFPTGPLDIIQAWVEVAVTDAAGRELFRSGAVDERNFIEPGTFMFKAEPIDRYGNLIDRHNLWEMVGVRFKRSLFPGAAEVAQYEIACAGSAPAADAHGTAPQDMAVALPADAAGELTVTALLHYRKFDQYLLNFAFGADKGITAPITTMARAETRVRVVAPRSGPADGE